MYLQGVLSGTCSQWGMGEESGMSAMYVARDAQWHMSPEEDLCHVQWGRLVTHVPSG